MFLPYRSLCARKGIRAKEVILYDIDIPGALCEYINVNSITTFVLGTSQRNAIARAFKSADVPTSVGKSAPDFCSVYSISNKGKPNLIKSANGSVACPISGSSFISGPLSFVSATSSTSQNSFSTNSSASSSSQSHSWWSANSEAFSMDGVSHSKQSLNGKSWENSREYPIPKPSVRDTASSSNNGESLNIFAREKRPGAKNQKPETSYDYSSFGSSYHSSENSGTRDSEFGRKKKSAAGRNNALQQSTRYRNLRGRNLDALVYMPSEFCDTSEAQSFQSDDVSYEFLDQSHVSDSSRTSISSQTTEIEEEVKRMKLELMQITEKYNAASQEEVREISPCESEEASIDDSNRPQLVALAMVEKEKQKCKAAMEMAQKAQRLAEMEAEKRKRAELKFKQESEEKQKVIGAIGRIGPQYRQYTFAEIEAATDNFSSSKKIGEGGYGPVYKASLDHTSVAIKVLSSNATEGQKQFQREVSVLSQMRHPNIVILLGACNERGCLVYEHMENGSLESQLFSKNRATPALPWRARFRIAAEIATALNFLHQTKPQPLVHRDLKPDNILLDKNYKSKISDVGLARLVPPAVVDCITQYHMTAAAGTFCYIDPEYQQTGMLGTKSDIYSLGVILLQIITAKPPMGLSYNVERAIETGRFMEILDRNVPDWPVDGALSLAKLALRCCELRKKDRPDLDSEILPELDRLRNL
ncbi:U-box domain-containing protein 52-like isoform X2 [Andrographis paniculata]|nr:U-box domain-containing protein 52-like isoform X2 [Andrographis paniculata]